MDRQVRLSYSRKALGGVQGRARCRGQEWLRLVFVETLCDISVPGPALYAVRVRYRVGTTRQSAVHRCSIQNTKMRLTYPYRILSMLQHAMSRMLKGSVPVACVVELDLKVSGP